jgi:hypothetical protein
LAVSVTAVANTWRAATESVAVAVSATSPLNVLAATAKASAADADSDTLALNAGDAETTSSAVAAVSFKPPHGSSPQAPKPQPELPTKALKVLAATDTESEALAVSDALVLNDCPAATASDALAVSETAVANV